MEPPPLPPPLTTPPPPPPPPPRLPREDGGDSAAVVEVVSPTNESRPDDLNELVSSISLRSVSLPSLPMTLSHAASGFARSYRSDNSALVALSHERIAWRLLVLRSTECATRSCSDDLAASSLIAAA